MEILHILTYQCLWRDVLTITDDKSPLRWDGSSFRRVAWLPNRHIHDSCRSRRGKEIWVNGLGYKGAMLKWMGEIRAQENSLLSFTFANSKLQIEWTHSAQRRVREQGTWLKMKLSGFVWTNQELYLFSLVFIRIFLFFCVKRNPFLVWFLNFISSHKENVHIYQGHLCLSMIGKFYSLWITTAVYFIHRFFEILNNLILLISRSVARQVSGLFSSSIA